MKFFIMLALEASLLFGAVDLNTASEKELSSLHGIGSSKAKAIISYRKSHCFKSITELANVKGIGEKIIKKNKNNLSISSCKK